MSSRREKNNHERDSPLGIGSQSSKDKYVDENLQTTDSDAGEANVGMRQASQLSENDIEEGDEDYEDETK